MSGSGSSFSAWLTPDVPNGGRTLAGGTSPTGKRVDGSKAQVGLQNQARSWPTPTTRDHKGSGTAIERSDGKLRNDMLDWVAERFWSTPRASDGEKGGPNQSFGAGGTPLPAMASQWMTPRSHEAGQYQRSRGDKVRTGLPLTGQAFSRPDPETSTDGEMPSNERRSLNPLFVEWLMGWPPGWTSFACSAMALSRWSQHMRCALSQLASPDPVQPVQMSLFGG